MESRLQKKILEAKKPQYIIANEVGIPSPRLSEYVHGRRQMTIPHLLQLCEYFRCNPDELIGEDEYLDFSIRVG